MREIYYACLITLSFKAKLLFLTMNKNSYYEVFSLRGGTYAEALNKWPQIRQHEYDSFLSLLKLKKGETFLDVPSGNGILQQLLPNGVIYHGLDPCPSFYTESITNGLQTSKSSLRNTSLNSGSFDVIGSLAGLHHEGSRLEVYREFYRLLKPGGRLVIMDVGEGTKIARFLNDFVNTHSSIGHDGYFLNKTDLLEISSVGFRIDQNFSSEYCWVANNKIQMITFMKMLFGLDKLLEENILAEELSKNMSAITLNNSFNVPWCLSVVTAQKH